MLAAGGRPFLAQSFQVSGISLVYREWLFTLPIMHNQHELMTLTELCRELGISESTAYYWRQIGKGPKGARIGKALRYRRSDVVAWVDKQFAA